MSVLLLTVNSSANIFFYTYLLPLFVIYVSSGAFKQLNQSMDPCVDFYEYACGGWEKENALGPGDTFVTGFSVVRWKTYNILKYALENVKANYSSVRTVQLSIHFNF